MPFLPSDRAFRLLTCVLMLTASVGVGAQGARPKAEVRPVVEYDGVHAGVVVRVALEVELPDGVHVQSDKPRDPLLIPTIVAVDPPAGITVREIAYPEPVDFTLAGQKEPLAVFERRFVIGVTLATNRDVAPGELAVPARFRYQACNATTCFAPAREDLRWTLRIVPAGAPVAPQHLAIFNRIRIGR
jgi:DsbC/DsbD-like thiol-disulfide interchange protein